jgi:hypothetical protein
VAYATGGLETSLFTFLVLAGFLLTDWNPHRPAALAAAGGVLGLAALTRPDGLLPAGILAAFVLVRGRPRWACTAAFVAAFLVAWGPATVWRVGYYGDFFPNTYYAKSADRSWYGQGLRYLQLYLERYWILLAGPLLAVGHPLARRYRKLAAPGAPPDRGSEQAVLAGVLAAGYALWVVRIGGDFMFARMLVPITPLLLILVEHAWWRTCRGRGPLAHLAAAGLLAAMLVTPAPVTATEWRYGVAHEQSFYAEPRVRLLDHTAEVLRPQFAGLPVRVAFYGTEARVAYKARFPVAIEANAGLTEPGVAHLPLERRGRVGHEKLAPLDYLILERKAHFTFSRAPAELLDMDSRIPRVFVHFGSGVIGRVLHWDPALMDALRRRGADVPDFLATLDEYLARIDGIPDAQLAQEYGRLRRFYFAHVPDPRREAPFLQRLGSGG